MADVTASPYIHDGSADNFDVMVLENSAKGPVLVNFWSRKAGPCMRQYPVLDKVIHALEGRVLLVNVDTDEHKRLSREQGVTSVPTLKLFRLGEVAETWHGYQSETDLMRALEKYLARPSDRYLQQALQEWQAGQADQALAVLADGIVEDPQNIRLPLTLVKLLLRQGRLDDAEQLLGSMPPEQREDEQVEMLLTHTGFLKAASRSPDIDELQTRLAKDPQDCEARYQLAASRLVADDYAAAMDELLRIMQTDREFNDDVGRRGLLAIFAMLGKGHALVGEYKNRMRDLIYT